MQSPEDFWRLLLEGTDAVTEVPESRWDHKQFSHPGRIPGKSYTMQAGTLGDVSRFDAGFFGLSPREVEQMDPQQRLLLELTWEALERGGQIPERLAGSNCAVYVGSSTTDYADIRQGDPTGANAYFMLGSTLSIIANRISYLFDLRGPSMAIDTACSSALVALHEAFHAVRDGRADMAIVGAVNMLLSPLLFVGFSQASMLSPTGRSKTFDKSADGYVRAEGGGVVVLKPLEAAERDGDSILAVIKGVGINADGRTHGIAQPSAERQEELLRRVYREFDADPRDLAYFEAHGTGTAVGDPIEARAIGRALGQARPHLTPLLVGSAKSNIGHLEPASGMAGLIKGIEVLRRGIIPPTLHVTELNPNIPFEELNLSVVRASEAYERGERPALVGVNSFGFGGANAHVILEEYRGPGAKDSPEAQPPLFISAKSNEALVASCAQLVAAAERQSAAPYDFAFTLALRRSRHAHRLVLRPGPDQTAAQALRAWANGRVPTGATSGQALGAPAKIGFVYSGNGAQWLGMGLRLMAEDEVFRRAVEEIDALVRAAAGWSIVEELKAPQQASRIADTRFAQPMLFAIQVGITESLRARGLVPAAVAGHSVGEVAAACCAGALDLRQSVRVILSRSEVQAKTRGLGSMIAVQISAERAAAEIAPFSGELEVAAINGPNAVTIAGDHAAVHWLTQRLQREGIEFRKLDLDYPFHSRYLDPFEADLASLLGDLRAKSSDLPFYSTVTGAPLDGTRLKAGYWWENARQPVRFHQAVHAMIADGYNLFVEIGPHPILQGYVRQALRAADTEGMPLAVLDRAESGAVRLSLAVDRAYCAGAALDWSALFPVRGRHAELPTYPWQRDSHWYPVTPEARGPIYTRSEAALLGRRVEPTVPVWERLIDTEVMPFLGDHRVGGTPVFPAAGFIEMAFEASRLLFATDRHSLEQFEIRRALVLDAPKILRFTWNPDQHTFQIASRRYASDESWTVHVTGRINLPSETGPADAVAFAKGAGDTRVDAAEHYALAMRLGLDYGPHFQTVAEVSISGDNATVVLTNPEHTEADFILHPAMLDGCLQGLFDLLRHRDASAGSGTLYLPAQFGRIVVLGSLDAIATCDITLQRRSLRSIVAHYTLRDRTGQAVLAMHDARFQRLDLERRSRAPLRYAFAPIPLVPAWGDSPALAPAQISARAGEADETLDDVARAWCAAVEQTSPSEDRGPLRDLVAALARESRPADAVGCWRSTLGARPDLLAELTMLGRAGMALPKVLAGEDAERCLPSPATLEHFLDASPSVAAIHDAVADIVGRTVQDWPRTRRLRVLEIGGLSVRLTRRLLALLPAGATDYVIAAEDDAWLAHVEGEFSGNPAIRTIRLDPDLSAPAVGEAFDLIVSVNAAGAWPSMDAALGQWSKLGRNGTGLVVASLAPSPWLRLMAAMHQSAGKRFPVALDIADRPSAGAPDWIHSAVTPLADHGVVLSAICSLPAPAESGAATESRSWLILAGSRGPEAAAADVITRALEARGERVLRIHPLEDNAEAAEGRIFLDAGDPAAWKDFFGVLTETEGTIPTVVHLLGFGRPAADGVAPKLRCWSPIAIAQGVPDSAAFDLVLLTSRTALDSATELTADAPLWGLARVLRNERPKWRIRSIEVPDARLGSIADALATELCRPDREDEIVIDHDRRLGFRLSELESEAEHAIGDGRVLAFGSGSLDKMHWQAMTRRAPEAGEIEIEVRATGLNFRDVMLAQGILPDEAVENGFAGATIGMEASGVVVRVGPGVADFAPGDAVLCFGPACFATHVTVRSMMVAAKPAALSFEAAATVPTVFFTVYYALHHLANLRRGERILIHGAAGGVGLAAIQYARHVGAEVFATAGSTEKREVVRLLGIPEDHVLDSRSLGFAEQVLAVTRGEGVDVVLNSLAGEAIHRSLGVLRPFGRFLELGKRDFFANTPLGLKPFRNNISYFGIDADQLIAVRHDLSSRMFGEVMQLFASGVFTPLPYRVFASGRIVEAFRHMQQARHIGKIIVSMDERAAATPVSASQRPTCLALDSRATYLVTGGLGGFGLATARWLAAKGARHLILLGRKGAADESARSALADFAAAGVAATAMACDVTDAAAMTAIIGDIPADRPLKGVFHAAAVFEDAAVGNLTWSKFERVLAPKVQGSDALHRATSGLKLDFFVLFSSVTTLLGNPGQANYVAANCYLEALARHRRSQGLPALAVG
ncbi:SDR family NAD(P)-dependent oxidoreductase [Dongia sp.]|uniref:SDR family NAD(P)-dependent oxidoreductase n=1 Tax=Dongia sp. TaxID=1977262 RepID=UPI0037516D06